MRRLGNDSQRGSEQVPETYQGTRGAILLGGPYSGMVVGWDPAPAAVWLLEGAYVRIDEPEDLAHRRTRLYRWREVDVSPAGYRGSSR